MILSLKTPQLLKKCILLANSWRIKKEGKKCKHIHTFWDKQTDTQMMMYVCNYLHGQQVYLEVFFIKQSWPRFISMEIFVFHISGNHDSWRKAVVATKDKHISVERWSVQKDLFQHAYNHSRAHTHTHSHTHTHAHRQYAVMCKNSQRKS